MAPDVVERKLVAIAFADVVEYGRLMSADAVATASEPISGAPSFLCTNAIVPFEQGFLGVTDSQGGAANGDLFWRHER